MSEFHTGRLPLWKLTKAADMPYRELYPALRDLGLPVWTDTVTGESYTSKRAFRDFLVNAASGGAR